MLGRTLTVPSVSGLDQDAHHSLGPQRCAVRRAVNLSTKDEVQTLTCCALCGLGQVTGPL